MNVHTDGVRGLENKNKLCMRKISKEKPRCILPRHHIDSYYTVGEEVYLRILPMSRFRDHDDELLYFGTFCRLETDVSAKKLILCNEKGETATQ